MHWLLRCETPFSAWRPREELFDTLLDPCEVHNLADDPAYADLKRGLHERLVAWREQQNDHKTGPDPVPNKKATAP